MEDRQKKYVRILSAALIVQAALFYGTSRGENVPNVRPLRDFSNQLGTWTTAQVGYVDAETMAVLQADDTLSRFYASPRSQASPSLFVAFFKSQRTGKAPHSPKNCLPGSGWEPSREDYLTIQIPGTGESIDVNRYVVAKGEQKSLSLYWYQSRGRVVASEYKAKFWTVADAIRYNRSDTALVRVIVPVQGTDEAGAERVAIEFVQSLFLPLRQYLAS
jgi:EpsI family protein